MFCGSGGAGQSRDRRKARYDNGLRRAFAKELRIASSPARFVERARARFVPRMAIQSLTPSMLPRRMNLPRAHRRLRIGPRCRSRFAPVDSRIDFVTVSRRMRCIGLGTETQRRLQTVPYGPAAIIARAMRAQGCVVLMAGSIRTYPRYSTPSFRGRRISRPSIDAAKTAVALIGGSDRRTKRETRRRDKAE